VPGELTPMDGQKVIGITFTDKPVTAFGGLARFVACAERMGLAATLPASLPFPVTAPNATPPHQILPAVVAGVLAGARRFAQRAVLRADEPVCHLCGLRRFPSTATFTRFFRRFSAKTVPEPVAPLFAACLAHLPPRAAGYTPGSRLERLRTVRRPGGHAQRVHPEDAGPPRAPSALRGPARRPRQSRPRKIGQAGKWKLCSTRRDD